MICEAAPKSVLGFALAKRTKRDALKKQSGGLFLAGAGSNPVSSSTKKSGTLVPLFLWKCKAYIEPVTEVRTWFCFSKTDEARRVKKQSGGLFLAGAGSNPVSSSTKKSGTLVPLFLWKCKAYIEPVTEVRTPLSEIGE